MTMAYLTHDRRGALSLASAAMLSVALRIAPAAAAEYEAERHYELSHNGAPLGRLDLWMKRENEVLRTRFRSRRVGLAALAGPRWSLLETTSRITAEGVMPLRYRARLVKPDRERSIEMIYRGDGSIAEFTYLNDERVRHEPRLETSRLAGSVDPLSAIQRLRRWYLDGASSGERRETVFDGRKLYDIDVRTSDTADVTVVLIGREGFEEGDPLMTMPGGEVTPIDVRLEESRLALPASARSTGEITIERVDA